MYKQRPKSRRIRTTRKQSCRIKMHTTDGPPCNDGRSGVHKAEAVRSPTTASLAQEAYDGRSVATRRTVRRTKRTTAAESAKKGGSGREREGRRESPSCTRRMVRCYTKDDKDREEKKDDVKRSYTTDDPACNVGRSIIHNKCLTSPTVDSNS